MCTLMEARSTPLVFSSLATPSSSASPTALYSYACWFVHSHVEICKNLPPEFLSQFLEAMGRLKSWSWLTLKRHSFQNIDEKHIRSWEIIAGGNISEININRLWSTLHNKRWDQGTSLSNHLGFCHWFTTCQWYKLDFTTAHKKSMDHWHHW
jgi:hypothetical protein